VAIVKVKTAISTAIEAIMYTDQNPNTVSKAILHACWQEENEAGKQAARPWLRWFLTRVIGIAIIPTRESDRTQASKKQWLSARKEQALKIDPERVEVFWEHGQVLDPYGLYHLADEEKCIGRNYFTRSPGSDVWVSFDDLPKTVRDRLWARISAGDFDDDDLGWLFDDTDVGGTDPALANGCSSGSRGAGTNGP
jgi:hypothetical protein